MHHMKTTSETNEKLLKDSHPENIDAKTAQTADEMLEEIQDYLISSDAKAAKSLDNAISSVGKVEHDNVSSVQLVAL